MLGRQEREFPRLNSGADLISSWQLAVTVAERACVPAGEGNKERGQRFPRENLGSCGATGGAPAGAEAFPKGFGLQPALGGAAGAAHLTLRCPFCGYGEGGSPEKAAGEGSSGGKRAGGGFAARPFFSPLSQPTKAGLLDAPLAAEHPPPPLQPGELRGQRGRGKGFGSQFCR